MNRRWSVVHALTSQILIMTEDQLRRGWCLSECGAAEVARRLLSTGLVEKTTVLSPRPEELTQPICSWSAPRAPPDLGPISHEAIKRWRKPPRRMTVLYASAHAANLTGGLSGRPKNPFQAQHSLQITETLLAYRRNWHALAECWVLPEMLPRNSEHRRGRVPDAFLVDPEGIPFRAIEIVGSYPVSRLESLHLSCSRQHLAYELW
jgi:hypothetical protein